MVRKIYDIGYRNNKVEVINIQDNLYTFACDCGYVFTRRIGLDSVPSMCRRCKTLREDAILMDTSSITRGYTPEEKQMIDDYLKRRADGV